MQKEQKQLAEMFRNIRFHSYTVWTCPNCGRYFNNYHEKCPECGKAPLEEELSKWPAK